MSVFLEHVGGLCIIILHDVLTARLIQ